MPLRRAQRIDDVTVEVTLVACLVRRMDCGDVCQAALLVEAADPLDGAATLTGAQLGGKRDDLADIDVGIGAVVAFHSLGRAEEGDQLRAIGGDI